MTSEVRVSLSTQIRLRGTHPVERLAIEEILRESAKAGGKIKVSTGDSDDEMVICLEHS